MLHDRQRHRKVRWERAEDAAQRGVEVKVILPGVSDVGLVLYAGRSFYGGGQIRFGD